MTLLKKIEYLIKNSSLENKNLTLKFRKNLKVCKKLIYNNNI